MGGLAWSLARADQGAALAGTLCALSGGRRLPGLLDAPAGPREPAVAHPSLAPRADPHVLAGRYPGVDPAADAVQPALHLRQPAARPVAVVDGQCIADPVLLHQLLD